jgi:thioredoxin-like negative regulator of GroEL
MPTIQKMYEKYGDKVNFVIVSVDTKPEQAKQFVNSKAFTMPIYTGDLNALSNDYSLSAIPVSIIIDKHGKILKQNVGGMDEAELEKFLTPIVKPASY